MTTQLVRDLQHAHPGVDAAKFHIVPNGWDEAESTPLVHAPRQPDGTFIIGHAGRFYYSPEKRAAVMEPWWRKSPAHWLQYTPRREDWLYRSPYFFFRAVRRLLDWRPELEGRLRLKFAGDVEDWFAAQVAEFRLQAVVEHVGRLSHEACLAFEARCDALLVTSVKVPASRDYCIAGKTFEYLTMGRPILGIVTAGGAAGFSCRGRRRRDCATRTTWRRFTRDRTADRRWHRAGARRGRHCRVSSTRNDRPDRRASCAGRAPLSALPRLLYFSDVLAESTYSGALLMHRLLEAYPTDRLVIVETSHHGLSPSSGYLV